MKKANSNFGKGIRSSKLRRQWKMLEKLYSTHLFAPAASTTRIPKIIHQIWLGGPLPEKYYALQKTWQDCHPGWQYRLWTDADMPDFRFTDRVRFESAKNKGEQSDILRYEILHQFGGLYVDTDFECVKSFDELHHLCDFYVGLEAALPGSGHIGIGNALIASVPGHPILQHCIQEISKSETGGDPDTIQKVTGPEALKRAFLLLCEKGEYRNVAFPYTYFYPLPSSCREKCVDKADWVQEESYGIHYWHISWLLN
jgi:mannosyltransferase OCH1-like enzyme